jgi:hypothetical protein
MHWNDHHQYALRLKLKYQDCLPILSLVLLLLSFLPDLQNYQNWIIIYFPIDVYFTVFVPRSSLSFKAIQCIWKCFFNFSWLPLWQQSMIQFLQPLSTLLNRSCSIAKAFPLASNWESKSRFCSYYFAMPRLYFLKAGFLHYIHFIANAP